MTTYPPELREYGDVGLPYNNAVLTGWYLKAAAVHTTVPSMIWDSGDLLIAHEFSADGNILGTAAPTATGLTFASILNAIGPTGSAGSALTFLATAGSAGQSQINSPAASSATNACGIGCTRIARSTGLGASAQNVGLAGAGPSNSRATTLTRTGTNSGVLFVGCDWGATAGMSALILSGSGGAPTSLLMDANGADYGVYALWYPNEGAPGTTTYGFSGTPSNDWAKVAVEVLGTNTAPPTPPTPGAGTENKLAMDAMIDKMGTW